MTDQSWGADFAMLRLHLDRALDVSRRLTASLPAELDATDELTDIARLMEEIATARSLAGQLSERLHGGPLGSLSHGQPLSREAFYVLVALGVLGGGSYAGDPYDDFQMLLFEDDERRSYITLDPKPSGGKGSVHAGLWPEEISWERLRPEQRDYFERHLPNIAARFVRSRQPP
jgi:hypothetical protein